MEVKSTSNEDLKKVELPVEEVLLNRIEILNNEIAVELWKPAYDKETLIILKSKRDLVLRTLEGNWVNLDKKRILGTEELILLLKNTSKQKEEKRSTTQKPDKYQKNGDWWKKTTKPRSYDAPKRRYTQKAWDTEDDLLIGKNDPLKYNTKIIYRDPNIPEIKQQKDWSQIVSIEKGKKYIINPRWDLVNEDLYDDIIPTADGYIVRKSKKWWVIDKEWKKIVALMYDSIKAIKW